MEDPPELWRRLDESAEALWRRLDERYSKTSSYLDVMGLCGHGQVTRPHVTIAIADCWYRPLVNVPGDWIATAGCDTTFPILVVQGAPVPDNRCAFTYRVVDGRHRITRLLSEDVNIIPAYVFTIEEALT